MNLRLCFYNMAQYLSQSKTNSRSTTNLRRKGLRPESRYSIQTPGKEKAGKDNQEFTGDFRMNVGIGWPVKGSFKSQVLVITETGNGKDLTD